MSPRRGHGLFEVVSEKVEAAAREASRELDEAAIPHALIGGVAVGAYARPRATRDVDFLLPASARAELSGKRVVGHLSGVTWRIGGVNVDLMFADDDEQFLEASLDTPREVSGVPVLDPEPLVYLKLVTGRRRDTNDIIDMIQAGLDPGRVRRYLERHADDLLDDFDQVVALAREEG